MFLFLTLLALFNLLLLQLHDGAVLVLKSDADHSRRPRVHPHHTLQRIVISLLDECIQLLVSFTWFKLIRLNEAIDLSTIGFEIGGADGIAKRFAAARMVQDIPVLSEHVEDIANCLAAGTDWADGAVEAAGDVVVEVLVSAFDAAQGSVVQVFEIFKGTLQDFFVDTLLNQEAHVLFGDEFSREAARAELLILETLVQCTDAREEWIVRRLFANERAVTHLVDEPDAEIKECLDDVFAWMSYGGLIDSISQETCRHWDSPIAWHSGGIGVGKI